MGSNTKLFLKASDEMGLVIKATFKSNLDGRFGAGVEFSCRPAKSYTPDISTQITAKVF
ncbi:hypothetical protein D3C85_1078640 [compost metagenome]